MRHELPVALIDMDGVLADFDAEVHSRIADRPTIQHAETASWQHIIFDQPANRGIAGPTIRRLKTWRDPNLPQLLRQSIQLTS